MLRSKKAAAQSSSSSTSSSWRNTTLHHHHHPTQYEDEYRNDVDSSTTTVMEMTSRGATNSGGNISIGSLNISINSNGSNGSSNNKNSGSNNNSGRGGDNSSSSSSSGNNRSGSGVGSSNEEISVSNLRKLYSTLLEELAPLHYELGTGNNTHPYDFGASASNTTGETNNNGSTNGGGNNKNANYRWKNSGTITVDGTDDTGYDYYYTPDDTVQSWRLRGLASSRDNAANGSNKGGDGSGDSKGRKKKFGRRKTNSKNLIEGGITGGDWSKDGIKRYYTGGNTTPTTASASASAYKSNNATTAVKAVNGKRNAVKKEKGMVERNNEEVEENDKEEPPQQQQLDERFSIGEDEGDDVIEDVLDDADDDDVFDIILTPVPSMDAGDDDDDDDDEKDNGDESTPPQQVAGTVNVADYSKKINLQHQHLKKTKKKQTAASIMKSSSNSSTSSSNTARHSTPSPSQATFESLYQLNPTTTSWHLRSAYAPTNPQEEQLQSFGTDTNSSNSNNNNRANSIMSGINMAQNSEVRVCHALKRISEILCVSERHKGKQFIISKSRKYRNGEIVDTVTELRDDEEEDDEELEVSEAVFAYFCEKNVLPMLIDSFLNRPSQLLGPNDEDDEDDNDDDEWWNKDKKNDPFLSSESSSLFSGVSWTVSVKCQILQTIAMLLLNTTSPLSLAYLLSNNYMNELIMGMLPLSQWREDALDEMLPPFVTLLRGLVMKLRGEEGKGLIPLLLCQRPKSTDNDVGDDEEEENGVVTESETYMPLLYAAVQVFCYSPGSELRDVDGSLVRTTAMNAILNLCRITSTDIRAVFVGDSSSASDNMLPSTTKSAPPSLSVFNVEPKSPVRESMLSPPSSPIPSASSSLSVSSFPNATLEQRILFPYICSNIKSCYHRCVRLMMTSISIDKSPKHDDDAKADATQRNIDLASNLFAELQYWLGFVDDLLSCDIRVWNVRLVEYFMREVVVGTILLHWNRALSVVGADGSTKAATVFKEDSLERCKARSERRVSIIFLTQLFAMVSYRPLVRLAGAAVLHPKCPLAWCGDDEAVFGTSESASSSGNENFFRVTPIINAIVSNKEMDSGGDNSIKTGSEEADAGAGVKEDAFVPSRHRAALLEMLAGDEAIIASMLLGTILENDSLDNAALEKLGVLPSPQDDMQISPFEEALANFLANKTEERLDAEPIQMTTSPRKYERSNSGAEGGKKPIETLSVAVEFVSSLGLMLMERIIYHTWTEGGDCLDAVPFDHYYKSSKFIQSLTSSLTYFASYTKQLTEDDSMEDFFKAEFERRYIATDANSHRPYEKNSVKMACCVQHYFPSNFIDDANVLLQTSAQRPSTESADDKTAKCAIRLTLHLRSLVGCIDEFYTRFTSLNGPRQITNKRWYGEAEMLSFCTIEEADDLLLSIGGVQTTRIPDVGTEIDLRGRKSFRCSVQYQKQRRAFDKGLVLVVDPSEIYVARCKKGDINRCIVLAVIPLSTIIASASAGETLHVVCPMAQVPTAVEEDVLKDGRLSLCFNNIATSISAKELLDKYCTAAENRKAMVIGELLDSCLEAGNKLLAATSQSALRGGEAREEEAWADFQEA